jgi:hypothetical protein
MLLSELTAFSKRDRRLGSYVESMDQQPIKKNRINRTRPIMKALQTMAVVGAQCDKLTRADKKS